MVAHRYNLRFSTKEDSRKRPCAFRKTSYSIKRPRANKTTSTPVVDISDANSACDNYDIATTLKDTRLIYQNPQHWTLHHLKAVNLQHETDVALDRIVDANYIPSDSDPEFQDIAACIHDPVLEETGAFSRDYLGEPWPPFYKFFDAISYFKSFGKVFMPHDNMSLISSILREIHSDRLLTMRISPRLPLSVGAFNACKGLQLDGSISWMSVEDGTKGMPPTVVSKKETGDLGMAKYEIPQLLLQINMAFNYDESFGEYEAFVISIEDFTYTFLRAATSPQYIRSLRAGQPANGSLKVSRSKPFNVVDKGVRIEFLRGLMALDRYLVQRPEFSFPMQKLV